MRPSPHEAKVVAGAAEAVTARNARARSALNVMVSILKGEVKEESEKMD